MKQLLPILISIYFRFVPYVHYLFMQIVNPCRRASSKPSNMKEKNNIEKKKSRKINLPYILLTQSLKFCWKKILSLHPTLIQKLTNKRTHMLLTFYLFYDFFKIFLLVVFLVIHHSVNSFVSKHYNAHYAHIEVGLITVQLCFKTFVYPGFTQP